MNHTTSVMDWYVLWARHENEDRYLLWCSDEVDGVEVVDGIVPYWTAQSALLAYAQEKGYPLILETPKVHDLDHASRFVDGSATVEWSMLLTVWNLFHDVAVSTRHDELLAMDEKANVLYDRLFRLSALTSKSEDSAILELVCPEGREQADKIEEHMRLSDIEISELRNVR